MDSFYLNLHRYAVRGRILDRAEGLMKAQKEGASLPFDEFIACNIGLFFVVISIQLLSM